MVIENNAKIVCVGADWFCDGIITDEIRHWFGEMTLGGVEFFECGKKGDTAADVWERMDEILQLSPTMLLLAVGENDIIGALKTGEREEAVAGFCAALTKILDRCRERDIKPILCTCPVPFGGDKEKLTEIEEVSIGFCTAVRTLAQKYRAYLCELHEEFVLQLLLGGEFYKNDIELTEQGERTAGRIIAEQILGAGIEINPQ